MQKHANITRGCTYVISLALDILIRTHIHTCTRLSINACMVREDGHLRRLLHVGVRHEREQRAGAQDLGGLERAAQRRRHHELCGGRRRRRLRPRAVAAVASESAEEGRPQDALRGQGGAGGAGLAAANSTWSDSTNVYNGLSFL